MGVSTTHRINLSMWILIYSFSDTYYVWAACDDGRTFSATIYVWWRSPRSIKRRVWYTFYSVKDFLCKCLVYMHILIGPMLLLFKCKLYSFLLQINNKKEQITKLQSKLDNLTNAVADMKARMDPLNKEVMERHVIGLYIEIVLILLLFILLSLIHIWRCRRIERCRSRWSPYH